MTWLDQWLAPTPATSPTPAWTSSCAAATSATPTMRAGWSPPARWARRPRVDAETELWIKLDFARRGAPKLPNVQGPGVVAESLIGFGTPEQREHVRAVARGDVWWCLGMSEPEAGSDLASLRTRPSPRHKAASRSTARRSGPRTPASPSTACCSPAPATRLRPPRHLRLYRADGSAPGSPSARSTRSGSRTRSSARSSSTASRSPSRPCLAPLNGGWKVAMSSLGARAGHGLDHEPGRDRGGAADDPRGARRGPRPELEVELGALEADADSIWLTGLRGLASRMRGQARPRDHPAEALLDRGGPARLPARRAGLRPRVRGPARHHPRRRHRRRRDRGARGDDLRRHLRGPAEHHRRAGPGAAALTCPADDASPTTSRCASCATACGG